MAGEDTIWVRTVPDVEGKRFHAEISQGQDTVLSLTQNQALQWAGAVHAAVTAAEYDAAVWRQMDSIIGDMTDDDTDRRAAIVQVITDLRQDRPASYFVQSLSVQPGVNARLEPFVTMLINGEPVGQWTAEQARHHAEGCLDVASVAKLDTDYLRTLTTVVGLETDRALNIIVDLAEHRQ